MCESWDRLIRPVGVAHKKENAFAGAFKMGHSSCRCDATGLQMQPRYSPASKSMSLLGDSIVYFPGYIFKSPTEVEVDAVSSSVLSNSLPIFQLKILDGSESEET